MKKSPLSNNWNSHVYENTRQLLFNRWLSLCNLISFLFALAPTPLHFILLLFFYSLTGDTRKGYIKLCREEDRYIIMIRDSIDTSSSSNKAKWLVLVVECNNVGFFGLRPSWGINKVKIRSLTWEPYHNVDSQTAEKALKVTKYLKQILDLSKGNIHSFIKVSLDNIFLRFKISI